PAMSKFQPHLIIIPEDEANDAIAIGFSTHDAVDNRRIQRKKVAGGWNKAVELSKAQYDYLKAYPTAHLLMLIDMDGNPSRREQVTASIPDDLKNRVFVLGTA